MFRAVPTDPLPRLTGVGTTDEISGMTRISTRPSGMIFGVTVNCTPTCRRSMLLEITPVAVTLLVVTIGIS